MSQPTLRRKLEMNDLGQAHDLVTESQQPARVAKGSQRDREALTGTDPMILLAYSTLREDFATWCAHRPAGGALPRAGDIHQMRIAMRRMRVALRLFERFLPAGTRSELNQELRWFAGALGSVRDLDVYAENLADYARAAGLRPEALAGYALALGRARDRAREGLRGVLAGDRLRALTAALETLVSGPTPAALRRWQSFRIDDGAPPCLRDAQRRVLKRGRRIDRTAAPEELHALRIAVKRFRYELELFAKIYRRLGAPAKAAKRLQDVLGEFQDACTAVERLQVWLDSGMLEGSATESEAVRQLLEGQRARGAAVLDRLDDEWHAFEKRVARRTIIRAFPK